MNIDICCICKGTGELVKDVGYHSSKYEYHKCFNCNGTGRVLTKTFQFSVPFDTNINLVNKADSEIFEIIRKLESTKKKR